MITGFNTDIEYGGVTYHVQTEDKGVDTPLILSLVYDRGTILASKRTPYDDLIAEGFDERKLTERLQKQHKLICAAVRAGRIEDLKKMTAKAAGAKSEAAAPQPPPVVSAEPAPAPPRTELRDSSGSTANEKNELIRRFARNPEPELEIPDESVKRPRAATVARTTPPTPAKSSEPLNTGGLSPRALAEIVGKPDADQADAASQQAIPQPKEPYVPAIPQPDEELVWDLPLTVIDESNIIIDATTIVEDVTIIAPDAVAVISDPVGSPVADAGSGSLEIEFLNETSFRAGERKTLNIRVFRGRSDFFVPDAQVMVKVLGSSFRPLIFHARTNFQGLATVHLQLPNFKSGRGAILVRAMHDGQEAELRQIVKQG